MLPDDTLNEHHDTDDHRKTAIPIPAQLAGALDAAFGDPPGSPGSVSELARAVIRRLLPYVRDSDRVDMAWPRRCVRTAGDTVEAAAVIGHLFGCIDRTVATGALHQAPDIARLTGSLARSINELPSLLYTLAADLEVSAGTGTARTDYGGDARQALYSSARTLRSTARIVTDVNPVPPLTDVTTALAALRH